MQGEGPKIVKEWENFRLVWTGATWEGQEKLGDNWREVEPVAAFYGLARRVDQDKAPA